VLCPFLSRVLSMQRLIKGFAVGILCLQWSLPASAQIILLPATCDPAISNPLPLTNTSLTELDAEGSFQLNCSCPEGTVVTGTDDSFITLSIDALVSTTRNGTAGIRLSDSGSPFTEKIVRISYRSTTNYAVNVSAPSREILQAGDYSVSIKFELSDFPQCLPSPG
jgi:hypothetical protein